MRVDEARDDPTHKQCCSRPLFYSWYDTNKNGAIELNELQVRRLGEVEPNPPHPATLPPGLARILPAPIVYKQGLSSNQHLNLPPLPPQQKVLLDLGMLDGKGAREAAACAENHMRAADPSGSGALTLETFGRRVLAL
jgi:hypothetical protein